MIEPDTKVPHRKRAKEEASEGGGRKGFIFFFSFSFRGSWRSCRLQLRSPGAKESGWEEEGGRRKLQLGVPKQWERRGKRTKRRRSHGVTFFFPFFPPLAGVTRTNVATLGGPGGGGLGGRSDTARGAASYEASREHGCRGLGREDLVKVTKFAPHKDKNPKSPKMLHSKGRK